MYQSKTDIDEQLHPVLIKLLEKAIQECNEGKFFLHKKVKQKVREKYLFIK